MTCAGCDAASFALTEVTMGPGIKHARLHNLLLLHRMSQIQRPTEMLCALTIAYMALATTWQKHSLTEPFITFYIKTWN